mgnify:FL=1
MQVDLILLFDGYDYLPVTLDNIYKEALKHAKNFKNMPDQSRHDLLKIQE